VRRLQRVQTAATAPDAEDDVATGLSAAGVPTAEADGAEPVARATEPTGRGSDVEGSSPDEPATKARLEADLELLAHRCATCQADLEAANWTIAGLRHQLPTPEDDATPEVRKLEDALQAARTEIAELRARLRGGDEDER
jgi:hypothetical protein